jgi:hypothetical protein
MLPLLLLLIDVEVNSVFTSSIYVHVIMKFLEIVFLLLRDIMPKSKNEIILIACSQSKSIYSKLAGFRIVTLFVKKQRKKNK